MGFFDSSKYRVEPAMIEIEKDNKNICKLLSLLECQIAFNNVLEIRYGSNEKKLSPSPETLKNLVLEISSMDSHDGTIDKNGYRKKLFFPNDERTKYVQMALDSIQKDAQKGKVKEKCWYVLEGKTQPDIFIETDSFVLIGEGKWTERGITTSTDHLKTEEGKYRSQMVRHIQDSIYYTSKPIIAFYVVDAKWDQKYVNDITKEGFAKQVDNESLPLTIEEKKALNSCYYGYITWQQLEQAFGIHFLTRDEIKKLKSK